MASRAFRGLYSSRRWRLFTSGPPEFRTHYGDTSGDILSPNIARIVEKWTKWRSDFLTKNGPIPAQKPKNKISATTSPEVGQSNERYHITATPSIVLVVGLLDYLVYCVFRSKSNLSPVCFTKHNYLTNKTTIFSKIRMLEWNQSLRVIFGYGPINTRLSTGPLVYENSTNFFFERTIKYDI